MIVLTFEEFNTNFIIHNKATSNIETRNMGRDINLKPIQILIRDQTPDSINDSNFNIIVNLHPTDGTHCVIDIRRDGGETCYFDSFGVETKTFFLEE